MHSIQTGGARRNRSIDRPTRRSIGPSMHAPPPQISTDARSAAAAGRGPSLPTPSCSARPGWRPPMPGPAARWPTARLLVAVVVVALPLLVGGPGALRACARGLGRGGCQGVMGRRAMVEPIRSSAFIRRTQPPAGKGGSRRRHARRDSSSCCCACCLLLERASVSMGVAVRIGCVRACPPFIAAYLADVEHSSSGWMRRAS